MLILQAFQHQSPLPSRFLARFATLELAAIVVCLGLSTQISRAATNSSWSSQNNWNSDSPPGNSGDSASQEIDSHSHPINKSTTSSKAALNKPLSPFSPGSHNVSLEMGQVFLMGNLGNNYSDNIGTQLHYTYGVSDLFGFDSSVGYSSHSNGDFSMLSALAGLRTNLAWYDKVIPYFSFGLGFYRPSYSASGGASGSSQILLPAGQSVSTTLFGLHMGPGVDLEISRNIFFGASLTFHDMFGSTQTLANNQTFNTGGTYTSFFLHAGVTF